MFRWIQSGHAKICLCLRRYLSMTVPAMCRCSRQSCSGFSTLPATMRSCTWRPPLAACSSQPPWPATYTLSKAERTMTRQGPVLAGTATGETQETHTHVTLRMPAHVGKGARKYWWVCGVASMWSWLCRTSFLVIAGVAAAQTVASMWLYLRTRAAYKLEYQRLRKFAEEVHANPEE